ncbi:MAG: diacylglycerol kinase family lipid kinase [Lachnospiraceae bacterium]|nr:diacylglycerol kinase family lipid kinase [Lachnospiraceae bacterium]
MDRKKMVVLINEAAGKKKGPQSIMNIVRRAAKEGYEPTVFPIIPGEINSEDILKSFDGRADMVLCVGGDGTLNHVISGTMAMKDKPRIGYIPAGSTNDFSKSLGIPAGFGKALETAFTGRPFSYDVGKMGSGSFFNYTAAFGAFSEISYGTDQKLKNVLGYAAYILTAASALPENLGFKRHIKIEADGFTEEGDYLFGTVSNSVSIGGLDFLKSFDVKLDDGKMELLLIRSPEKAVEIGNIISALMRGDVNDPHISFHQVTKVSLTADEELAWSIDGEYGGSFVKSEIEVMPGAVTVMCGK